MGTAPSRAGTRLALQVVVVFIGGPWGKNEGVAFRRGTGAGRNLLGRTIRLGNRAVTAELAAVAVAIVPMVREGRPGTQ
jgi:hypothetical protein